MWRPAALMAFVSLLMLSSRASDPDKVDRPAEKTVDPDKVVIENLPPADHVSALRKSDREPSRGKIQKVELVRFIDLPLPSQRPAFDRQDETEVVVQVGEDRTALTVEVENVDEVEKLALEPDFAATVQKELARLSCYRGRVDNVWGPMSRKAVARFNQMASESLPIDRPTPKLLRKLKKLSGNFCVTGCTTGAKGGQCQVAQRTPANRKLPAYLPPWMRGEETPAEQPVVTASADPAAGAKPAPSPARVVEVWTERKTAREVKRFQPRKVRRRHWRRRARTSSPAEFWPGR